MSCLQMVMYLKWLFYMKLRNLKRNELEESLRSEYASIDSIREIINRPSSSDIPPNISITNQRISLMAAYGDLIEDFENLKGFEKDQILSAFEELNEEFSKKSGDALLASGELELKEIDIEDMKKEAENLTEEIMNERLSQVRLQKQCSLFVTKKQKK